MTYIYHDNEVTDRLAKSTSKTISHFFTQLGTLDESHFNLMMSPNQPLA